VGKTKVLLVIAQQGFQDHEYSEPKKTLENAGIETKTASKTTSQALGKLGTRVKPDLTLAQAQANDYDAIIFIGGPGAANYFNDEQALKLARESQKNGKITAAICIAPSILANAGLLKGKRATSWPSESENLRAKGAEYTGENVTRDGLVITASGPHAAREFGQTILNTLKEKEKEKTLD